MCGGDGIVGWVFVVLEEIRRYLVCLELFVVILFLGIGGFSYRFEGWVFRVVFIVGFIRDFWWFMDYVCFFFF